MTPALVRLPARVTGPRIDFWKVAVLDMDGRLEIFDEDITTFLARVLVTPDSRLPFGGYVPSAKPSFVPKRTPVDR